MACLVQGNLRCIDRTFGLHLMTQLQVIPKPLLACPMSFQENTINIGRHAIFGSVNLSWVTIRLALFLWFQAEQSDTV